MAARKRTSAARTASAAATKSSTGTSNKRRKPNTQPLGLKLLLKKNAGNAESKIVRLYVGNILGRKPSKPPPSNIVTPVRHVDIGIDDPHIPRKLLQVSRVTAHSLELDVFFDQTQADADKAAKAHRKCVTLSADICQIVRNSSTIKLEPGNTIVLKQDDIFQVSKTCKVCTFHYEFQVLPVAEETTTISPTVSVEEGENEQEEAVQDDKKSRALQKKQEEELDRLEKKLGFRPYRPARSFGSTSRNKITIEKPAAATRTPTEAASKKNDDEEDSDSDDDDEDDQAAKKDPESTMHATLGSTYYKALQTSTPHFGSSLLDLVLSKHELPTPHLLDELVQLLTYGPTYHGDLAFWEGNRLQLALDYIQRLLVQQPKMGPRFLQATTRMDSHQYWRLLLDQLTVLPYKNNANNKTAKTVKTATGSGESESDTKIMDPLSQSLELHAVSLQFLLLLLEHSELLSQVQRDSKDVTRHLAQVMAHVWANRGYYLLGEDGPVLSNALEQVTRLLTKVLGLVTNFDLLKEQDLVDVLWSNMDRTYQQQAEDNDEEEEESASTKKKKNKRKVLLTWILQLEDLHASHAKWNKVTDGLVKRARLRKEYNAVTKV